MSAMIQDRALWIGNKNSYPIYRMVLFPMTLNDLAKDSIILIIIIIIIISTFIERHVCLQTAAEALKQWHEASRGLSAIAKLLVLAYFCSNPANRQAEQMTADRTDRITSALAQVMKRFHFSESVLCSRSYSLELSRCPHPFSWYVFDI